ncbi:MAG: phosphatidylserine decarboxylase [Bacilli bacterium]
MFQYLYRIMIELTNKKWSSVLLKRFAQSKASKSIVPHFASVYKINQDEMSQELHQYPTLHAFFTRTLKPDARPIAPGENVVVSPVDGVIEDMGAIDQNLQIMAKNKPYSILEMLGNEENASYYAGGTFMVIYLSPTDYHRIHAPISAEVVRTESLGNASYPVNKAGLKYGVRTLSKNYREVTELQTSSVTLAMVKVGAMFVNSIERVGLFEKVEKGQEMAYFTFGSTVVLLFPKNGIELADSIVASKAVVVGEPLGVLPA